MRKANKARGFTLMESMAALTLMMVGGVGLLGAATLGMQMNGNARKMAQATAIAQDLINNINLWRYSETTGSPLANVSTSNDADIGDTANALLSDADPLGSGKADHGEA